MCSVGLIPKRLPFVTNNTAIRTFRHAVSLDERRAKFKANLFNRPTAWEAQLGVQPGEMPKPSIPATLAAGTWNVDTIKTWVDKVGEDAAAETEAEEARHNQLESQYSRDSHGLEETNVLEVWFSGCHCGAHIPSIRTPSLFANGFPS